MVRIVTANEPNAITITVDGQLVDDCVDAVETCSYQAMGGCSQGRHMDHRQAGKITSASDYGYNPSARIIQFGLKYNF